MLGLTKGQRADWALLRGQIFEEFKAAGCCAEWLLRMARRPSFSHFAAMLRSADGMVFCAEHGIPSPGAFRWAEQLFVLPTYNIYVDGASGGFERWQAGGVAVFAGEAQSNVRCEQPRLYSILALHGAEVNVSAAAGARVQIYYGGNASVRLENIDAESNIVIWDNETHGWGEGVL